ncbi:hypothetical protein RHMOL_Rhmol05G0172000 [Rhododendron molle]|uniref:Uncharacterized protein n=1 Tax=Rhododendron molle TaxID=49168 RepID=A0ACC0NQB6_RHOML|nr:hypothetical protein RHMOL_Rhmol05G0172000 [Rhododendron molle]
MIFGNAKIPSRHSTVALMESSGELHDFFPLVLVKLLLYLYPIGDLFVMWPADCFVAFSFRMADRYVGQELKLCGRPTRF